LGIDDKRGADSERDETNPEHQPREDMAFPEDFRRLMRRIFGPWNRKR